MEYRVSSGLFSLPANAKSVDWMVINDAQAAQTFTVTVYKCGAGPKTVVAPGPLSQTLKPGVASHNANSVGPGKPFEPGFYYEVVVDRDDHRLLPSVAVWSDFGNSEIPGTLISPAAFVGI
ncbi:MAG: hypothetical protein ACM3PC_14845 [Deltaproteobacteria bacterium]